MSLPARPYTAAALLALALWLPARACADPAPAGSQAGRPLRAAVSDAARTHGPSVCGIVELPVVGRVASELACEVGLGVASGGLGAVAGLAGEAAGSVGGGILNDLAEWMIAAATQVTVFVSRQMSQTTTPQLTSGWYEAQFQPMADLGAGLGLLVAMIALASAAIRRSPQALAQALAGIARAGLGTGVVVALTALALEVTDGISTAVLAGSPHAFWATVAHAWGTSGFGGFGSSALALLISGIEVFAGVFVWLELIARNAAIYVAVLFFPASLAAAIWPALASWPGRHGRLLMLFVILKPVALIVLSLAGSAAAAGLSFNGGVSGSVGTILAAIVIFALAAFAPWALMYLLAADAESAYMAAGLRAGAGAALGSEHGRSVRNAGGLRDHATSTPGTGASGGGALGPGGPGPAGDNGDSGGPGVGGPSPSGGGAAGGSAGEPDAADGTLPVGAQSIGGGSVGAAAGLASPTGSTGDSHSVGDHAPPAEDQAGGFTGEPPAPGVLGPVPDGPAGAERAGRPAAAGGATTDAPPQRPGSAGPPAPDPAPDPADSPPTRHDPLATPPVAASPQRRTRRGLTLVGASPGVPPRDRPPDGEEG
jgi:hypothetical protein